jgi:hypothetical protein
MSCNDCCTIVCDNLSFCSAQVKEKFNDDLLIGTEHSKKIIPECQTPQNSIYQLTQDEKVQIVLNDPKFGMFALFKWHIKKGYKNEILKRKNAFYCSHTFSLLAFLPILIFISQWIIYISFISYEITQYDKGLCPNDSVWQKKAIMFAVSLVYFVRSFFLWDNLTDRTRLNRMTPSIDFWVMLDTFQEYGFNLFVYLANLWIIFSTDEVIEMILNSLAMEFLMDLDNEFEEMYFHFLPEVAEDIYDNFFLTFEDNKKKLEKRNKSCGFKCARYTFYIPFKLLVISLLIFPVICLIMAIYGPICK